MKAMHEVKRQLADMSAIFYANGKEYAQQGNAEAREWNSGFAAGLALSLMMIRNAESKASESDIQEALDRR